MDQMETQTKIKTFKMKDCIIVSLWLKLETKKWGLVFHAIPLEIQDLNWLFYWIELVKNYFELNILLNWIGQSWQFSFESKIELIVFERNSIIDWIVKLYLPGLGWVGSFQISFQHISRVQYPCQILPLLTTWSRINDLPSNQVSWVKSGVDLDVEEADGTAHSDHNECCDW